MKFVNVSSNTNSIARGKCVAYLCAELLQRLVGAIWCISAHLKCDLSHLRLSAVARFLATVTKGIVLFHGSATSTLL